MPTWNDDERTIIEMFSYMRPMGSDSERDFIERYILPVGFEADEFGNLVLQIGDNPRTLFSSHVDTVHRKEGRAWLSYENGTLGLAKRSKQQMVGCLGADDTAGIWLMLEMIKAGVEGVYVIHYGEESGCIGSGDLATKKPEFFAGIDHAVAFDRMGREDIITHQSGYRTCSDAFALALAAQLGGNYAPNDGGAYTDTNEYRGLVPECTNVSVGYYRQHSQNETQDVPFLIALRDKLIGVDWADLPAEREPSLFDEGYGFEDWYSKGFTTERSVESLCRTYPAAVACILHAYGIGFEELTEQIDDHYGLGIHSYSGRQAA